MPFSPRHARLQLSPGSRSSEKSLNAKKHDVARMAKKQSPTQGRRSSAPRVFRWLSGQVKSLSKAFNLSFGGTASINHMPPRSFSASGGLSHNTFKLSTPRQQSNATAQGRAVLHPVHFLRRRFPVHRTNSTSQNMQMVLSWIASLPKLLSGLFSPRPNLCFRIVCAKTSQPLKDRDPLCLKRFKILQRSEDRGPVIHITNAMCSRQFRGPSQRPRQEAS